MLEIMDVVSMHPSGATMMEVADRLDFPKSSVYRLVNNLVEEGYLEGGGRHSRYRLGRRFLRQYHNSALSKNLVDLARPALHYLSTQLDEAVNMNSLIGLHIHPVCAEFPRSETVRTMIMPGDFFPIHATASGKVICAFQESALQQEMLEHNELVRYRPNTIVDRESLIHELAQVKAQGYATIDDELDENVLAISVPVMLGNAGVIYSIGVVGFRQRILSKNSVLEIVKQLRVGAEEISRLLASSRLDRAEQ